MKNYISKLYDTIFIVTHNFPWKSNSLIVKASDKEAVSIETPYNTATTVLMYD